MLLPCHSVGGSAAFVVVAFVAAIVLIVFVMEATLANVTLIFGNVTV
jgi:hypothetical protein